MASPNIPSSDAMPAAIDNEEPLSLSDSLSGNTLAALQEFLAEQKAASESKRDDTFKEDWALSQFWYSKDTAHRLAEEVVQKSQGGRIACVACPSLFRELKVRMCPFKV